MPPTMLPEPTTSATSRPSSCTATISRARQSTVPSSTPYDFAPIRASPDSFRRTRRNGELCGSGVALATRLLCQSEAPELDDLEAGRGHRLADTGLAARVVDPDLFGEDAVGQPLLDPALDHLGLHLVRLALEVGLLQEDLALGFDLR